MSNQFCKVFAVGDGHQMLVVADEDEPKIICTTLIDALFVRLALVYEKDSQDLSFRARDRALCAFDQNLADTAFLQALAIVEPNMADDL